MGILYFNVRCPLRQCTMKDIRLTMLTFGRDGHDIIQYSLRRSLAARAPPSRYIYQAALSTTDHLQCRHLYLRWVNSLVWTAEYNGLPVALLVWYHSRRPNTTNSFNIPYVPNLTLPDQSQTASITQQYQTTYYIEMRTRDRCCPQSVSHSAGMQCCFPSNTHPGRRLGLQFYGSQNIRRSFAHRRNHGH